jgi:hypothetical protein
MEPDGPSPCSQEPLIRPYSEPAESSSHPETVLRTILVVPSHLELNDLIGSVLCFQLRL